MKVSIYALKSVENLCNAKKATSNGPTAPCGKDTLSMLFKHQLV